MKIISFLNSKGGVGKTTLCVNIASYFFKNNFNVLVVDADPQGSVRDWYDARQENNEPYPTPIFEVIGADRKHLIGDLRKFLLGKNYDYVLIDTPGKLTDIVSVVITISDLCILPVLPSPYDIWSTESAIELVKIRQSLNENLKATLLINRAIPNTRISHEVMTELQKCGFPVMQQVVNQRVIYAESAGKGESVFNSMNETAIAEMTKIGESLEVLLHDNEVKKQP